MNLRKCLVLLCAFSLASAVCDINDFTCDNDIEFPAGSNKFFVTASLPVVDSKRVLLDSKITLQFNSIISKTSPKAGFFVLLNQRSGIRTEFTANCISQPGDYTLVFDVPMCLGDVMDADTDYLFFISQKLVNGNIATFSNQRGIEISALYYLEMRSSIVFRTIPHIPAVVVPGLCSPAFEAKGVSLTTSVIITFSSPIHVGKGSVTLTSANHPTHSRSISITDTQFVTITNDNYGILIHNVLLNGDDRYQVTFPAGIVRSESGSNCGTTDSFFFETEKDEIAPTIKSISPANYQTNLPLSTRIRIAFSKSVTPADGFINFHSSHQSNIRVSALSTTEVTCTNDVCTVTPTGGFTEGTYEMTFAKTVFADLSGNVLNEGVSAHVFSIGGKDCGLGYVNVDTNEDCQCASVNDQCYCQCGEVTFVKEL